MINIAIKKCIYENCLKQPNYNFNTEKRAIYCAQHKTYGMVDLIHKKCNQEGCSK